jgi:hypothetical protein
MRKIKIAVVFVALLIAVGLRSSTQGQAVSEIPLDFVTRGLAIAPVPLNVQGKDLRLLGFGSYLVNSVGGCVGCHTNPTYTSSGNPFSGQPEQINTANYLAGGARFGPFTSRNLTPDRQTGKPANLDFNQFVQVMRTGADVKRLHPQMGPLLQVMPWPDYSKMTDTSLLAIYTYLSAVPHAEPVQ